MEKPWNTLHEATAAEVKTYLERLAALTEGDSGKATVKLPDEIMDAPPASPEQRAAECFKVACALALATFFKDKVYKAFKGAELKRQGKKKTRVFVALDSNIVKAAGYDEKEFLLALSVNIVAAFAELCGQGTPLTDLVNAAEA